MQNLKEIRLFKVLQSTKIFIYGGSSKMLKKKTTILTTFALLFSIASITPIVTVNADTNALAKVPGYSNPLITQKFGADPYAMVYNGRVYIYLSSDAFMYDNNGNVIDNNYSNIKTITVISSDDMVNWTDHGEIPVAGSSSAAKWASNSWAPAVTHKVINGKEKFFLYFGNNAGSVGVITSDTPIGPWTDPIGKPLITTSTSGVNGVVWLFDPAVLVDDNGTGYLYFGGGVPDNQSANPKTARVIKLSDDMIHTDGSAAVIDSPFMFEDSGIHKYNGKYYYSYCSNFSGTHSAGTPPQGTIAYMMSNNPMGPFTYAGTFLKNPGSFFGVGGNNHHAVFQFKNQWYVAYHAQTLGKAMGITKGYRSPHINKLEYNGDGTIKDVLGDTQGVPQVANLNPYIRTEAETIGWNGGIKTEKSQAPGSMVSSINLDVTSINNGDWISVSKADFGDGATSFKANIASTVGGKIEIHLDSITGELIGTLDVSSTGGEQQWREMQCNVKSVSGVHNIFFKFAGNNNTNLFNIDCWKFSPVDNTPTPVKATFYQDTDFGGTAVSLDSGNYTTTQLLAAGIPDNWASAIKVPAGYTVEMYDQDNFSGTKWTFTADNSNFLVSGCNDTMSSVKIYDNSNFKLGDVNSDGQVNSVDYALLKRYLLGNLSNINLKNSDMNSDGNINSIDSAALRRILLK
jgi:arabinoxylan arabinofuranohydrolase